MDDQSCPRCKTTKYRNPKLKLMVNVCGHKLCEACVDMLFTRPSAACPECSTPLRRNDFRIQQFEDLIVEKEVDIRKKILKIYNKREDDFDDEADPLRSYNDYLEEIETIIWNLANGIDIDDTKKQMEKYKKDNDALIRKNNFKLGRIEAITLSQLEDEQKEDEMRRIQAVATKKEEVKKKKKTKEAFIDDLIKDDRPLQDIVAEHIASLPKKQSLFFSGGNQFTKLQKPQDQFVPPLSVDAPMFVYNSYEEDTCGPKAPALEVLASRGYLQHVCRATEGQKAGGYASELACGRAIQEAFSALFLLDTEDY